jgi:hypothetical protein
VALLLLLLGAAVEQQEWHLIPMVHLEGDLWVVVVVLAQGHPRLLRHLLLLLLWYKRSWRLVRGSSSRRLLMQLGRAHHQLLLGRAHH